VSDDGFYSDRLEHDGRTRDYRVYLPNGYESQRRRPLVIALHGGLGSARLFELQAGLAPVADEHGFAVAYPNGVWRSFNAGRCCGRAARLDVDDVGFVGAVVDTLVARHGVERDRVYGTGFSNGAMMLHRIACERPGLFRAIAPVAGTLMVEPCPAAEPLAALLIQGRLDERIPWEGGELRGVYRPAMAEVVGAYAERNRCGRQEAAVGDACRQRAGCDAHAPVRYCGLPGVGHQWPGGNDVIGLGPNTEAFDATRRVFAFFSALN